MPLSLVIFEDNDVLRQSLVSLLRSTGQFTIVGDYPNALNVEEIIGLTTPDVVILDIDMPVMDGISAIPRIKQVHPEVSIVMYTQFEDDDKLFRSICAGADGYVLKKTSPFKLLESITEVNNGGSSLSPEIARRVLSTFRTQQRQSILKYELTGKETEILQLLVKGYSVKLIAFELHIAYETCRTHLRNIYRKLHVNCGKEAIAKVLAEKIKL